MTSVALEIYIDRFKKTTPNKQYQKHLTAAITIKIHCISKALSGCFNTDCLCNWTQAPLWQAPSVMALEAWKGSPTELKHAPPGTAYSWQGSAFSCALSSWFLLLLPSSCVHVTCISSLAGFVAKQPVLQAQLWACAGAEGCGGDAPGGLHPATTCTNRQKMLL